MAMENKRIIQLSRERTDPASDDYVMVDSPTGGTAKFLLKRVAETDDTLTVPGKAADSKKVGDEIDDLKNDLNNIRDGSQNIEFGYNQGVYVNCETGSISNAANYSIAKDEDGNVRIDIPNNCVKIVFNNIITIEDGVSGWATYSSKAGSAINKYIRGGKTHYIDVQDTDKVFAVSSFKNNGEFVTNFDITFIYSDTEKKLLEIEKKLSDVSDLSINPETISTEPNKYVDFRDGTVHSFQRDVYSIIKDVEIPQNVTQVCFDDVTFDTSGVAGWAIYDKNKTFIRGGQTNSFEVGPGEVYFSLTGQGHPSPTEIQIVFIFCSINERIYQLQKSIYGANKISNNNCKVVMLGDSIVGNFNGSGSIPVYLSEFTGAVCYNCAIGGSSLGSDLNNPDDFFEAFNGWKMIHAIATNDYSIMQTAIDNNPSRATYHQDHLDILKNMDWSTVDIITLSYGTNDWGTKVTLDDAQNPTSTDTFTGALRTSLIELWTVYPHIKVIVFGVIWRGLTISDGQITGDTDDGKHGRDWYLYEYEEKMKEVCEEYHVPFVPMYNYIGFNRYNWSIYFPATDGTHPNAVGRKAIAKRYAAHMIELTKN